MCPAGAGEASLKMECSFEKILLTRRLISFESENGVQVARSKLQVIKDEKFSEMYRSVITFRLGVTSRSTFFRVVVFVV
jgi:hypothetical protein